MVLKYAQMRNPLKGCLVLNMALLVLVQRVWSSPPPNSSTMGLWSGLQGWIKCGILWPRWSGWSIIRAVGQGKLVVSPRTKTAHTLAGSVNKKAEMVWSSSWGCPLENKRNHQGCPGTLGPLGSQESPVGPGLGLAALAPKLGGGGLGGGTNLCWALGWSSCIITGLGGKNSPPWKSSCGLSSGSNMCRARKLTRSYLCCT